MIFDAATKAQVEAANPTASTWLSANAGSGKTRVLTDRVARLLLGKTPPERILCLTYTKAAASEMQNRLFRRLGEWAMMPEAELRAALVKLGVAEQEISPSLIAEARTLFARAIETPGGLKIQTIHSFCASVLRRFPLEAEVSPRFVEMDDRARAGLVDVVLDEMADGPGQAALDGLASELGGEDALPFVSTLLSKREALTGGDVFDWLGLPAGFNASALASEVFLGGEEDLCRDVMGFLDPEHRQQGPARARLGSINWQMPSAADIDRLEKTFLSGSKTKTPDQAKIGSFPTKAIWGQMGALTNRLEAFMLRVEAARPRRRALRAAEKTQALHAFAEVFLPAYDAAKAARGWLDFDDLINRTAALLSDRGVAEWVLFRLDGGIDHILVDEAQDTSPTQWEIIAQLAGEFAAGSGARADTERTIFVVGDKKQSIYSFQGADPEGFDRMRQHFRDGLAEVGAPFQDKALTHSFRSAAPILNLVDAVFAGEAAAGVGQDVAHIAFKSDLPGRVDIWPVVEKSDSAEAAEWDDPVDLLAEDHHHVVLARNVAQAIDQMVRDGTPITGENGPRPVTPGDILILVQRRSALFHELIAAIKARVLPIAGADRMRLEAELAVKDLTALMAFLATPEDDLSLAEVLKSPLFGLDEAALFRLAYPRKQGVYLWRELQTRQDDFPGVVPMLEDLRNHADFLRPYDLLERVLQRHDGRRKLLARLGQEAEDGIDAMLGQAMAYERLEVPSLTGFVGWLQEGDVEVKRDPGSAAGQIRVMSVHGAKGLEAPVVILPDTGHRRVGRQGPKLVRPEGGPLIWATSKDDSPEPLLAPLAALDEKEAEERNRLLYVAMTRAESWLIICAAGEIETKSGGSWYTGIRDAAAGAGATQCQFFDGIGWRIETGDWTPVERDSSDEKPKMVLPGWAELPAPQEDRPEGPLSPSDLGGAKALPGDAGGLDEDAAKLRGRRLHLLLEYLPDIPKPAWAATAPGILAAEGEIDPDEADALLEEATRCLTAPELAAIFADDALAEVSVVAESTVLNRRLSGQIDRLIVAPDYVLAIDFKSNAVVPGKAIETPEGLLRQMGAYAEILGKLYPGLRVETAILWTKEARLTMLPHDIVMSALQRAAGA